MTPHVVTIAAVAVVSGTSGAYAAGLINGSQIRPHTITGRQIRNGSVGASVLTPLARASLRGAQGKPGVSGLQMLTNQENGVASGMDGFVSQDCPAGKRVIGVTAWWGATNISPTQTEIDATGTTGYALGHNAWTGSDRLHVQVVCAIVN